MSEKFFMIEPDKTEDKTPLFPVSGHDVEELLELIDFPGKGVFVPSNPVGYQIKTKLPLEPVSLNLFEKVTVKRNFERKVVDSVGVERLLKSIQTESGLSLYNEIVVGAMVEAGGEYSANQLREILSAKTEEPRGFIRQVSEALGKVRINPGSVSLVSREAHLKTVDRRVKKVSVALGNTKDRRRSELFVRAMALVEKLSHSFFENIGDVEGAFLEALVSGKEVDLVFLRCPRMVQYRDELGRNRLDVIPHCETVTLPSRDGERIYTGDEHLVSYLAAFRKAFGKLGIEVNPDVLVMESDVENMFPINDRTGLSSLYETVVVPKEDVVSARGKARRYMESLAEKCRGIDSSIRVASIEDVSRGTRFGEIKARVFDDTYRSKYREVKPREFEDSVADDLKRNRQIYPNYRREHAKYKVAHKIADMRGLSAVLGNYDNPVVITRGPVPVKQAHLANDSEYKSKRRVIFADAERDALEIFYE